MLSIINFIKFTIPLIKNHIRNNEQQDNDVAPYSDKKAFSECYVAFLG